MTRMEKTAFGGAAERLLSVDVIRTLSILIVLAGHLSAAGILGEHSPLLQRVWFGFLQNGSYGVSMFFTVSGFLITRIIASESGRRTGFSGLSFLRFYSRRAGRILPLLAITSLIGALAVQFLDKSFRGAEFSFLGAGVGVGLWMSIATFSYNWYRILHDRSVFDAGLHFAVLWSLAIEEQFYLFYPVFLRKLSSRKSICLLLTAVVLLGPLARYAAFRISPEDFLLTYTNSFSAFDQIAMGCLLYFAHERASGTSWRNGWISKLLLGIGVIAITGIYCKTSLGVPRHRILGPTALCLGVSTFLFGALGLRRSLSDSVKGLLDAFTLPGRLSYGIYLLHPLVLFLCWGMLRGARPWPAFFAYLGLNLALAWLSYYWVELPSNLWVRNGLAELAGLPGRKSETRA